MELNPSVG